MSWYNRRPLLAALLALPACGFTPVYGPDGAARGLSGQIAVDQPDDVFGFALVRRLEQRLGQPQAPRYSLSASILTDSEGVGITPDQTISRRNVLGRVHYTLTDIASGEPVTSGTVESFTSYSTTSTTVATTSARRDAQERLMVILADQIVARLLASAGDWRT